jgi:hypothetical protein
MQDNASKFVVACLIVTVGVAGVLWGCLLWEQVTDDIDGDLPPGSTFPSMPLVPNSSDVPETTLLNPPKGGNPVHVPDFKATSDYVDEANDPLDGLVRLLPPALRHATEDGFLGPEDDPVTKDPEVIYAPDQEPEEEPEEDPSGPKEKEDGDAGTAIDLPMGDDVPSISKLRVLAELEGRQDFSWSSDPFGQGQGRGQGQGGWGPNDGGTAPGGIGSGGAKEREVEEADIVKVRDDTLYVLNEFRGLFVVDVSDPETPTITGTVPVLGNPVDMYVDDGTAYIIVSYNYGYWYRYYNYYYGYGQGQGMGQSHRSYWGMYMSGYDYLIGSKLMVVDVSDPKAPFSILEMPIEGFVTDSRRVGDVLYYVSYCPRWYNQYTNTSLNDTTWVTSLNIEDIHDILKADATCFEGVSNQIYASSRYLYVAEWDSSGGNRWGTTDITIVDISDPEGSIAVTGEFEVEGQVDDKYQMDEWDDTIRVVSHFRGNAQQSELWTFDISDTFEPIALGHLVIEDEGTLMATRFAGDRGYTIHLPPPPPPPPPPPGDPPQPGRSSPDPLDVLDLSDPSNPVLCDVFEMPGWVTHMEVRGYKIIAIGVDDSEGQTNVAVSLFDVSDPWNVVMEERVRIGGDRAESLANSEPKALTVLDDLGVVLVPFISVFWEDGSLTSQIGVQVVSFDLEAGDLEVRGSFEQPDAVLRTRSVGGMVLSTSRDYLLVTDITDLDMPQLKVSYNLCPEVVDLHLASGRYAQLVLPTRGANLTLRVFPEGGSDVMPPIWEADLGSRHEARFWDDDMLHVVIRTMDEDEHIIFTVTSYNMLSATSKPVAVQTFDAGHQSTVLFRSWAWKDQGGWVSRPYRSPLSMSDLGNPVMLDGGMIAITTGNSLWLVSVGDRLSPAPVRRVIINYDDHYALLPAGRDVYIVDRYASVSMYEGKAVDVITYKLTLVKVDVQGAPEVCAPFRVPGIPMRVSSDGDYIYTHSTWFLDWPDGNTEALNVVYVGGEKATVVMAIYLTGWDMWLDGDTAVLTDVFVRAVEDEDGGTMYVYETQVIVLDLLSCSIQRLYVLPWGCYVLYFGNDLIILQQWGHSQLTALDLRRPAEASFQDIYIGMTGRTIHRYGDTLIVTEGKYGLRTILLG